MSKTTREKIKAIFFHPYFRIAMITCIIGLISSSCEYGPKHGRMFRNQNNANDEFQGAENEDFTESDLRYNDKIIVVTNHGRCRMGCREIDAFEVQEIIDQDNINESKSESLVSSGKCPTIAFEGYSRDKQHIRVILGDCKDEPIIITVIDLENKYNCDCS